MVLQLYHRGTLHLALFVHLAKDKRSVSLDTKFMQASAGNPFLCLLIFLQRSKLPQAVHAYTVGWAQIIYLYKVCVRYSWQKNHQTTVKYGVYIYPNLANPTKKSQEHEHRGEAGEKQAGASLCLNREERTAAL
jgi:hypothetical protein